jgi:predicted dehydrogenase
LIRVGVIGFGLAGQSFHAPIVRTTPGLELACIVERSGSAAPRMFSDVRAVRTVDEMLADEKIQLCVVATPHTSHFEIARRCMLAGRDVVVDKPFTVTSAEASELVQLAGQNKRVLSPYQNRRFDGDFQTVKKLVESGILGQVAEYEARYDRFRPELRPNWRDNPGPGAGVLFDLGPHLIDQALTLFGTPVAVNASVLRQREFSPVDDAFDVCFEYPKLRALLRARVLAYAPGPHFLIHGTKGSFSKYGMDPQEDPLRRGELPGSEHWGEDPETLWGTLSVAGSPPQTVKTEVGDYRRFYANVRDVILGKAALEVTAVDGFRTIRAIELAVQSSRERRWVPWSEA